MGMKVTFWHSDKPRERLLANAWKDGVLSGGRGDVVELRPLLPEPQVADCDVAVMFGVKSRELFRQHWDAGAHVIYVDKGYARHKANDPTGLWEYWRVAIDSHQPTARLYERECPPDRWNRLGLTIKPWFFKTRQAQQRILLAGSSQKYHDFYGLSDPTQWAGKVIRSLREMAPGQEIIYRPKPSWRDAVPIGGSTWGGGDAQSIDQVLERVDVLVTHGSNAVFDAMLAGVPQIVLGDAVTRQISTTTLSNDDPWPRYASDDERAHWAHNLAYFQWTLAEIAMGECWRWLRPMIYGHA